LSIVQALAIDPAAKALRDRIDARYRDPEAPDDIIDNTILAHLLDHRSVRAYLPDPLPAGTIETLVAAAQSAASSSNLQVWSVVAVEDPDRKARLAQLAGSQKHIVEAPLLLVWLIDFDRLTHIAEKRGVAANAIDYIETFLLGAVDTSLAAQNAVVALESLGLGSVYIGGIRNHPVQVAAELDLPSRMFPLFGLVVGKPDPERPAAVKPRLPQASVLFRETYGWSDRQDQAVRLYNDRLREFQHEQRMPERDWMDLVGDRTRGPESMAGRHALRDILETLGFELR
jgi:nitroreductase